MGGHAMRISEDVVHVYIWGRVRVVLENSGTTTVEGASGNAERINVTITREVLQDSVSMRPWNDTAVDSLG